MDKSEFLTKISEVIKNYNSAYAIKGNPPFYFRVERLVYSKNKTKRAIKYDKDYYSSVSDKKVVITHSAEKLFEFVRKNYGKIQIVFSVSQFIPGKRIYVGIIKDEINFSNVLTIAECLKNTEKETVLQKVIKRLKKQLKLKLSDKISFVYTVGEGRPAGKFEETSGEAIISGKIFTFFWLKFNQKKGHYLDYIDPIKINELK